MDEKTSETRQPVACEFCMTDWNNGGIHLSIAPIFQEKDSRDSAWVCDICVVAVLREALNSYARRSAMALAQRVRDSAIDLGVRAAEFSKAAEKLVAAAPEQTGGE